MPKAAPPRAKTRSQHLVEALEHANATARALDRVDLRTLGNRSPARKAIKSARNDVTQLLDDLHESIVAEAEELRRSH